MPRRPSTKLLCRHIRLAGLPGDSTREAPDLAQLSFDVWMIPERYTRNILVVPDGCGHERDIRNDLTLCIESMMVAVIGVIATMMKMLP